jgi:hypothetical protein
MGQELKTTLPQRVKWASFAIITALLLFASFTNSPQTHLHDRYATVIRVGDYTRTKYRSHNRVIDFKLSSGRIISLEQTTFIPPKVGEKVKIEFWKRRYFGSAPIYKILEPQRLSDGRSY